MLFSMFTNVYGCFVVTTPLSDFCPIFRSELGEDTGVTAVSEDPLENLGDLI